MALLERTVRVETASNGASFTIGIKITREQKVQQKSRQNDARVTADEE